MLHTIVGGLTTYVSGSNLVSTIPGGLQHFANHKILDLRPSSGTDRPKEGARYHGC